MTFDVQSAELAERIYAAFPVTEPAFLKLLGLLEIEATDRVETAAVALGARSRLQINPAFVARNCASDTDLTMLVLHELYHIVLGHTRLFPRLTLADNWAFDAVINAQLCQLFPQPHQTALFRRLYPADRFPFAMLRPPDGWRTKEEHWALEGRRGAVHRALYTDMSVTYKQLYDLLAKVSGEGDDHSGDGGAGEGRSSDSEGDPRELSIDDLLGNHAYESQLPPDLAGEVRDIIARWPMIEKRSGRDQGGEVDAAQVRREAARREAVAVIRKAILALADRDIDGNSPIMRMEWMDLPSALPYRTRPDRRANLREAAGEIPMFFRALTRQRGRRPVQRVHVYVDVSGSMDAAIPGVYAALVPLLDCVEPAIHLFSTKIADVSHAELRRGRSITTGGTDIGPVTAHLISHDVRRAVILTDGWVGRIPSEHVARMKAKGIHLGAVVTDDGDPAFVAPVGGRSWRLPNLS